MSPNHTGTMHDVIGQARADAVFSLMQMIRAVRAGIPCARYWWRRAHDAVRGYAELEREFVDVWPRAKTWAQAELDHRNKTAAASVDHGGGSNAAECDPAAIQMVHDR